MTLFVLKSASLQYESCRHVLTPSVFYAESSTQTEIEGLRQVYVPAQTGWQVSYNGEGELRTKLPGTEIVVTLDGMFYPLLAECHPRALIEEVELQLAAVLESNWLPIPEVQRWILLSDSMAARLASQPEVTLLEANQFVKKSDIKKGDELVALQKSAANNILRVVLVGENNLPAIGNLIHTQWDSLKPGPVIPKSEVVEAPFFKSNTLCVKSRQVQTAFDEMLNYLKLFEYIVSGDVLRMIRAIHNRPEYPGYQPLIDAIQESQDAVFNVPLSAEELQKNSPGSLCKALVRSSEFYEIPQYFTEDTLTEYFSKKSVLNVGKRQLSFLKVLSKQNSSVTLIEGPIELRRSRCKGNVILEDSAKKAYKLLCEPNIEKVPTEITYKEAVELIHALFSDTFLAIKSKEHFLELTRLFKVPLLT